MDELRKQISDEVLIRKAAKIMVLEFNNLLSPQMDVHQIEDLIQTIYNPGPMTRAFAKQIAMILCVSIDDNKVLKLRKIQECIHQKKLFS